MYVSIFLLFLLEECLVTFTICLLKASVFSFSVIFSLLLNVIALFESCLFFLFCNLLIVFQKVFMLFLWSQFSSSFSFQRLFLKFCISLLILSFRSFIFRSLLFIFLNLFLSFIKSRISLGRMFWIFLNFPFGMFFRC